MYVFTYSKEQQEITSNHACLKMGQPRWKSASNDVTVELLLLCLMPGINVRHCFCICFFGSALLLIVWKPLFVGQLPIKLLHQQQQQSSRFTCIPSISGSSLMAIYEALSLFLPPSQWWLWSPLVLSNLFGSPSLECALIRFIVKKVKAILFLFA